MYEKINLLRLRGVRPPPLVPEPSPTFIFFPTNQTSIENTADLNYIFL